MADDRPHRPFAADIQIMQRAFLVQASVGGIGVLKNFVAENNVFLRGDGQPYLLQITSRARRRCQTNSTVWISPLIRVGGVTNMI